MSKPWRWNGYEIDREDMRTVERLIATYPAKRARLAMLQARYAERSAPDYHTYRSPAADSAPGSPGAISDPVGHLVVAMDTYQEDLQRILCLDAWVTAFEMVLHERLDDLQRRLVTDYLVVPRHLREQSLAEIADDSHTSRSQLYHWLNTALLEFAHLYLDEWKIRIESGKSPEKNLGHAS